MTGNQMTWLFFGFSGRISRMAFLLAGLLMMLLVVFLAYRLTLAQEAGSSGAGWQLALSLALIASLWAQAALGAKRFHDFGRQGLLAALLFVPALNFVAFIALCLIPGNDGANQYGRITNAPAGA